MRKLHKEHNNLCISHNIIRVIESRKIKWVTRVTWMGDMINVESVMDGETQVKKLPEGLSCRRADNINMDIKIIGNEDVGWIQLAQCTDEMERFVQMVMNFRIQ